MKDYLQRIFVIVFCVGLISCSKTKSETPEELPPPITNQQKSHHAINQYPAFEQTTVSGYKVSIRIGRPIPTQITESQMSLSGGRNDN